MTKLSTAVLAVTASLALGAMTVSASAGHNNGGGNKRAFERRRRWWKRRQ